MIRQKYKGDNLLESGEIEEAILVYQAILNQEKDESVDEKFYGKIYAGLGAAYYRIENADGTSVYSEKLVPVEESFSYLTLLIGSLGEVRLSLYDKEQNPIGTASFHEDTQTVWIAAQ